MSMVFPFSGWLFSSIFVKEDIQSSGDVLVKAVYFIMMNRIAIMFELTISN